jgi:chromosome partitioning protein
MRWVGSTGGICSFATTGGNVTGKKKAEAPVVSVLNMKGGVGKTTISAHVLRELYLAHQKNILVIDFDPQFNLSQTVLTEIQYEKAKSENKTVLSVLEEPPGYSIYKTAASATSPPAPGSLITSLKVASNKAGAKVAKLDLLAGDFSLVKYSLVDDKALISEARRRFKLFLAHARQEYGNPSAN